MIVTVALEVDAVYVAEHVRLFPLVVHVGVLKEPPALPSLNVAEPVGTFVGIFGSTMVAVTWVEPPVLTEVGLTVTLVPEGSTTASVVVATFVVTVLS